MLVLFFEYIKLYILAKFDLNNIKIKLIIKYIKCILR